MKGSCAGTFNNRVENDRFVLGKLEIFRVDFGSFRENVKTIANREDIIQKSQQNCGPRVCLVIWGFGVF